MGAAMDASMALKDSEGTVKRSILRQDKASIEDEIRIVQSVQTQRSMPVLIIGNLLGISIITYMNPSAVIDSSAIYPFALIGLMVLLIIRGFFRLNGRPRPTRVSLRRIRTIYFMSFILGIFWAAGVVLVIPHLSQVHNIAVLISMFFICYGAVALRPSMPISAALYILPFLTATVISAYLHNVLEPGLLAFYTFNGLFGLGLSAWQNWRDTTEAVHLTLERVAVEAEHIRVLETISKGLGKYMSPQLYQAIFSGEQEIEIKSKRKKLTVFFSDIVNFTEITDQLEPEELTTLLNEYLTEMSGVALDHGGTLDKFIGDAVVIYFGDPKSNGVKNDATACVEMAMAMQKRLTVIQQDWKDRGLIDQPIQTRVGINTGYCTVGNFGSEERMDYTIIGNTVNMAARLETRAQAGGILIGNETHSLVKDWIYAEEQEPLVMKGFRKPYRTFKVIEAPDVLNNTDHLFHHQSTGATITIDRNLIDKTKVKKTLQKALDQLD
ncbi:MAG: class 3 adenylate cyclase [Sneathiella sp.]|jgi:adenylate cyclase